MKRSEINAYIREFREALDKISFRLPPFCEIRAQDWKNLGHEYDEIRERMLGWDITDFGSGDFKKIGLQLVTIRNGKLGDPESKTYAEKIMLVREGQVTPLHFHWSKMEDIINRGGARLAVQVWMADENEGLSGRAVPVTTDGITREVAPGTVLYLEPGESITMQRYLYHSFWGDGGDVVVGEVSMVNDDTKDNRFYEKQPRFAEIEEDEPAEYLLCNEYPAAE
ncbi:MAG: D-lyxose/D-mannose family sugar isomerase [Clostridia bacterium]|nr:D-lyxose/D-mannose family sugar isomerase [Clostridia bacterium]